MDYIPLLSDPPHYTEYPNPSFADFIKLNANQRPGADIGTLHTEKRL